MSGRKTVIGALEDIAQKIGGVGPQDWFTNVQSSPHEQVFVRYTKGPGRYSGDGKYVILNFKMYDLYGREDGYLNTVFEARYDPKDQSPLLKWVKPPNPVFDRPSPVEDVFIAGFTKATWTFGDGSSIVAVGPTLATVALYKDGGSGLFVRVAYAITGGTGRFNGALGALVSNGSTYLEKGQKIGPGTEFFGSAIEVFKVINERDITNTERS